MIIPFLFVTLITILIASYVGAPMSLLPVIIVFYILMYLLGSRKKDEEKKFVVKLDNQARRQNFFFSDKDKSIFNQNTFPMIVLDKSYTITLSNVAFINCNVLFSLEKYLGKIFVQFVFFGNNPNSV